MKTTLEAPAGFISNFPLAIRNLGPLYGVVLEDACDHVADCLSCEMTRRADYLAAHQTATQDLALALNNSAEHLATLGQHATATVIRAELARILVTLNRQIGALPA